ncbi:MAG: beta-propeller domain-containing protein [Actinomycetes bacterium]
MNRRQSLLAGTVTAAVVAGLGAVQLLPGAAPTARADGLVGYDDCAELLAHYRGELRRSATAYGFGYGGGFGALSDTAVSATAGAAERSSAGADAVGSGPTGTNVQEQGVDEPDMAKLQDGRLVVLTGKRIRVLSAEAQPRLLGSLRISGEQSYGGELLLDGQRAVALVPGFRPAPNPQESSSSGDVAVDRSMIYYPGTPTTRVLLLDLSGDQPRLVEESTFDAQYVSARLVDGTLRLVTTTRPQPIAVYPGGSTWFDEQAALAANQRRADDASLAEVLPQVLRTAADGTVLERGNAVDCRRTYHARTNRGAGTLLVTTLRPADGLAPTDTTAVTTDGDIVHASVDRLYVATSRWGTVGPVMPLDATRGTRTAASVDEVSTELHGFDTSSATGTRYLGSGSVPGYVLGRWALSSYDGALRVATTRQPPWDSERAGDTSSMVVKLVERDGRLVETGRVAGLGRTEQIRAVRYFGDIAAVVTFRQTDPLYLLDLSGDPKVLGELKIPGFSTYLHPLGDGKLLGLGQEATKTGRVTGVQVSVFDVSDLSAPAQVDRLQLGEGWSPALDDSRAFSYDPDRRLATFAFSSYTEVNGESSDAVGISVGDDGTLREVGRLDMGLQAWAGRVLLDDDHVYAVSDSGVVAGDADSMDRTGAVEFGLPD